MQDPRRRLADLFRSSRPTMCESFVTGLRKSLADTLRRNRLSDDQERAYYDAHRGDLGDGEQCGAFQAIRELRLSLCVPGR